MQSHEVQRPKDFEAAFARMAEERPNALLVLDDALTVQYQKEIVDFAREKRLPSVFADSTGRVLKRPDRCACYIKRTPLVSNEPSAVSTELRLQNEMIQTFERYRRGNKQTVASSPAACDQR